MQRHRRQELVQLAVVVGAEQTERPPFAGCQRWTPQPLEGSLCREFTGARRFPFTEVVHCLFVRSFGNVCRHLDEVLTPIHGNAPNRLVGMGYRSQDRICSLQGLLSGDAWWLPSLYAL